MNSKNLTSIIVFVVLLLPAISHAAFQPLIGIPGISDPNLNFNDYVNALYALSISIAGLLAVIKIIIAGVKYMLSDVVTSKQEAIGDIKGALIGLLIVLSAVLILNIINPQLTTSTLFTSPIDKAPKTSVVSKTSTAPTPVGTDLIKKAKAISDSTITTCKYTNSTEKAACIKKCEGGAVGVKATWTDKQGGLDFETGTITCTWISITNLIP